MTTLSEKDKRALTDDYFFVQDMADAVVAKIFQNDNSLKEFIGGVAEESINPVYIQELAYEYAGEAAYDAVDTELISRMEKLVQQAAEGILTEAIEQDITEAINTVKANAVRRAVAIVPKEVQNLVKEIDPFGNRNVELTDLRLNEAGVLSLYMNGVRVGEVDLAARFRMSFHAASAAYHDCKCQFDDEKSHDGLMAKERITNQKLDLMWQMVNEMQSTIDAQQERLEELGAI